MNLPDGLAVKLLDCEPAMDDFQSQVLEGLRARPRYLPCKFFYDQHGSELFDRICQLDEYYLTRTELGILDRHAADMAECMGDRCLLVEYGSGSSLKTRLLLDRLADPAGYVPIDISRTHLLQAAHKLSQRYPRLEVLPVCADYTAEFALPRCRRWIRRRVVYFPGSTIGNFEPHEARRFLRHTRQIGGPRGGLLIGVDFKKDPRLLHAAYNDAAGVTARFNLNLLSRINRELDGDFDLERFSHYAFYNPQRGRIEMHLVSLRQQEVRVAGESFAFQPGESIFTESSHKHTLEEFAALAAECGYRLDRTWTDDQAWFGVMYLEEA